MISIVIPTFNEEDNLLRITECIVLALQGQDFEILFIDDSTDDSVKLFDRLPERFPGVTIRGFHRDGQRGLGTAVVEGIHRAVNDIIVLLDADLQHPPEKIPDMVHEISQGADIVIPSQFILGGSDGGLSPLRKLASAAARWSARIALNKVRRITDPTSGFFAFRRHIVDVETLNPIGWKILLEILVKSRYQVVREIPYVFAPREVGNSKF